MYASIQLVEYEMATAGGDFISRGVLYYSQSNQAAMIRRHPFFVCVLLIVKPTPLALLQVRKVEPPSLFLLLLTPMPEEEDWAIYLQRL